MKKLIAIALVLVMCLSIFAACEQKPVETNPAPTLHILGITAAYIFSPYSHTAYLFISQIV